MHKYLIKLNFSINQKLSHAIRLIEFGQISIIFRDKIMHAIVVEYLRKISWNCPHVKPPETNTQVPMAFLGRTWTEKYKKNFITKKRLQSRL